MTQRQWSAGLRVCWPKCHLTTIRRWRLLTKWWKAVNYQQPKLIIAGAKRRVIGIVWEEWRPLGVYSRPDDFGDYFGAFPLRRLWGQKCEKTSLFGGAATSCWRPSRAIRAATVDGHHRRRHFSQLSQINFGPFHLQLTTVTSAMNTPNTFSDFQLMDWSAG